MAEDMIKCEWCEEDYEEFDLVETNLGMLCEHCIRAIRSRGEEVTEIEKDERRS